MMPIDSTQFAEKPYTNPWKSRQCFGNADTSTIIKQKPIVSYYFLVQWIPKDLRRDGETNKTETNLKISL